VVHDRRILAAIRRLDVRADGPDLLTSIAGAERIAGRAAP
jgi:hypothetical protein